MFRKRLSPPMVASRETDTTDSETLHSDASCDSPFKTTCIRTSVEPDVTLVIGGTKFLEYSHSLRSWSNYFDRGLSAGMRAQGSYEFMFPDRSPVEWQWIVSLMAPMTEETITMETLPTALDWFGFLCSDVGLRACDKVLCQHLPSMRSLQPKMIPLTFRTGTNQLVTEVECPRITEKQLALAMDHIECAVKYNLEDSKAVCFKIVRAALEKHASLFNKERLKTIAVLIKDHMACRSHFLVALQAHLPSCISSEQVDMLIDVNMFHEIINLQVDILKARKEYRLATTRMVDIAEGHYDVLDFKAAMKQDEFWGTVVPNSWG